MGFTVESINFLQGIEKYLSFSIKLQDHRMCIRQLTEAGLASHKLQTILRLSSKFESSVLVKKDLIYLLQKDPGRFAASVTKLTNFNLSPIYVIGRTMFETLSIPKVFLVFFLAFFFLLLILRELRKKELETSSRRAH